MLRSNIRLAAAMSLALVGGMVLPPAAAHAAETAGVFAVVQEGLTQSEGEALGKAYGIPNALETTGAFSYVDTATFNAVPLVDVAKGEDEQGRATLSQAVDVDRLRAVKPVSAEAALAKSKQLVELAGISPDMKLTTEVSNSRLTLADANGRPSVEQALDTTVSGHLTLDGLPVTGQGAKLRITFAPDGTVSQLSHALRQVARTGTVPVIDVAEAAKACAALYPAGTRQQTPTLGYQFPELGAVEANGKGTVSTIFPQYTCNPVAESGTLAHRLVPAVPGAAPSGKLAAKRSGESVEATVSVSGGTAPYTYAWSSSSTVLDDSQGGDSIAYQRAPRDAKADASEQLTVEVTDANGLAATATVTLDGDGDASAGTVPGGGGFGALAVGPTDVGIEQTIDDWQCAQDSANGFRSVMQSHGIPVAFDWRGNNAWEWDFKDVTLGGGDSSYVDNVDAVWYTGHGWSGGFTFKNGDSIVPSEARWGDTYDLEWLQLESCQVLTYPTSWKQSFRGLHILNGFHTNAYCVGGGTGATFANYLFPKKFLWWTLRPAQRVQAAWALMAIDREPSGVIYKSTGLWRPSDGVTNIGDYFWGQGPVGPDMYDSPSMGMWWISGTV